MLGFTASTKHEANCNVTHGVMGHLDSNQPPVKRKPFSAILNHNFVQKLEFILPEEIYEIIKKDLVTDHVNPVYSRVILPLEALVVGEFFNEYIKRGNILMLSEGWHGIDNLYSLKEGVLKLYLDKESYERAGIVGKPDGVKGKRGNKPRWSRPLENASHESVFDQSIVVELDLRAPSMLHGKKGFDRIVYAFKNVLTKPVTWLFIDLGNQALTPSPLDAHFPVRKAMAPKVSTGINVKMPSLKPPTAVNDHYGADFEDYAVETHEWLSLVQLESQRVGSEDKVDPYLSQYSIPGEAATNASLIKITWRGFLSPSWVHKTFVRLLLAAPRDSWVVCSVAGFGEGSLGEYKDCTILRLPDAPAEYVLWEIM